MNENQGGHMTTFSNLGRHSLLWIDGCPCFGCPYNENSECNDLKYSTSCTYIEAWALGLHSSNDNNSSKKAKTHVIPRKPSRWKLHSRQHSNSVESHGW